ncbi:MAG: hypothetical protein M3462_05755 [Chloroflexota bacterium]|nr:hypothetical protein [Chloroflexota bacterium]
MSGMGRHLPGSTEEHVAGHHAGLNSAEKYERVAFTFCKMGTTGLLAWALTPAVFVLLVAVAAIAFYGRAVSLGLTRSRCVLRRPALIIGFWAVVALADAAWLFGR